jgi:hypothetical protein
MVRQKFQVYKCEFDQIYVNSTLRPRGWQFIKFKIMIN